MVYMQILHTFLYKGFEHDRFWYLQEGPRTNLTSRPRETAVYAKERSKRKWNFRETASNSLLGHRLKKEQKGKRAGPDHEDLCMPCLGI